MSLEEKFDKLQEQLIDNINSENKELKDMLDELGKRMCGHETLEHENQNEIEILNKDKNNIKAVLKSGFDEIASFFARSDHSEKAFTTIALDIRKHLKKLEGSVSNESNPLQGKDGNRCFMGDCRKLYDKDDPCKDNEAKKGKWGKCHEYEPTIEHIDKVIDKVLEEQKTKKFRPNGILRPINYPPKPKEKTVCENAKNSQSEDVRPFVIDHQNKTAEVKCPFCKVYYNLVVKEIVEGAEYNLEKKLRAEFFKAIRELYDIAKGTKDISIVIDLIENSKYFTEKYSETSGDEQEK